MKNLISKVTILLVPNAGKFKMIKHHAKIYKL